MRILLVVYIIVVLILSCVSSKKSTNNKELKSEEIVITGAERLSGMEMYRNLDCTTCHNIDEKQIGPSYRQVSEKYKATQENIDRLAKKIISGGSGSWGQIPMTPHPALSIDSARTLVKFVLSVNKVQ
jgi:cytochrome c